MRMSKDIDILHLSGLYAVEAANRYHNTHEVFFLLLSRLKITRTHGETVHKPDENRVGSRLFAQNGQLLTL